MVKLAEVLPNGKTQWLASIIASIAMLLTGFALSQIFDMAGRAATHEAQISSLQTLVRENHEAIDSINETLGQLSVQMARLNTILERDGR